MKWSNLSCVLQPEICAPHGHETKSQPKLGTKVLLQSQVYLKMRRNNFYNKTNMNILRGRNKRSTWILRLKYEASITFCFCSELLQAALPGGLGGCAFPHLYFMGISVGKKFWEALKFMKGLLIYKHVTMLLLFVFKAAANKCKRRLKWHVGADKGKQQCDGRLTTAEFTGDGTWDTGRGQVLSCHFFRTVTLKLECTSVSPRGLVKTQISGPQPQSPWFPRSGVGSEYLLF